MPSARAYASRIVRLGSRGVLAPFPESARAAGCWALGALAALEGLRESGERVSLAAAVKKAGAFELFAETLARFPASSLAHRNATLARGQLRDALDRPEPPLNAREQWPMFGTHCLMS